jgi:uncharacterized Zn finger protein (UPF0148 family)
MTNVACFCGCLYFFDGGEGPCPQCGAVALVRTKAIRKTSENREQGEPDQAMAAALPGSLRMARTRGHDHIGGGAAVLAG